MNRLKKVQLLVLGDLGPELAGAWSGSTLSHVLGFRDGHLLPTIITSNIESLTAVDALEPRLAGRFAAGVLHLSGPDRRTAGRVAKRTAPPCMQAAR